MHSAQFCCASKRIYVHTSIYDKFAAAIVEASKSLKMGPGHEDGVLIGPLNNRQLYEKVGEFFKDSKKNGHKFLNGGEIHEGKGYFVPVSFVDSPPEDSKLVREVCDKSPRIIRTQSFMICLLIVLVLSSSSLHSFFTQEPFGPIVPLLKWDDEDGLIRRVNDSQWGLGASIWYKDVKKAESLGRRIESGMVWINEVRFKSMVVTKWLINLEDLHHCNNKFCTDPSLFYFIWQFMITLIITFYG